MNFFKSFIICLIVLTDINVYSQELELGKVTIAELEEKHHPKDTAAVAAILFKKGVTTFEYSEEYGFLLQTIVKTKIKIYKKGGYDWANKSIQYYVASSPKEYISFSKAVTYNLVNGAIEKTKLKSDGEFEEKVNKYRNRKKITMPNVKEGSIIEYEYTIRTPNDEHPRDWDFQTAIPINYCEYKVGIPEYYTYNSYTKGFLPLKVTKDIKNKGINFTFKERSSGLSPSTTFTTERLNYLENSTTYQIENVPALKDESYVNNIDNYTSTLVQELAMVKFPNRNLKSYSTDWKAVTKTIYDYQDFGQELDKTGYFEEAIGPLIAAGNTPEQKIAAIFNYVKQNVKWNGSHGFYCEDGVKTAFKNKKGNVGEINLMLTAMLRFAGFDANPVLVSTRENGIALYPSRTAFDYVIAAIEDPKGLLLLDGTAVHSLPNILPTRDLNWFGRLIRKDGTSTEVDLMPKVHSNDAITMNYSVGPTGKVEGKLRRMQTNYNAMLFRNQISSENQDAYLEKFENEHSKIEIEEYSRTNEKELHLPVTEVFSFKGSNLCEVIQDKMYITPMLFYTYKENPFKQETREYPIDYSFPFIDKYTINVQIPEGYTVETIPASINLSMLDELGTFKFLTNVSGNIIQVAVQHQVNVSIIGADYYPMLKEYYQKMIEKMNEKIVLKKA